MAFDRIWTPEARAVGFDAKHWSNSYARKWEGELLSRTRTVVEAFSADEEVPEELRLAADSIWNAVENAGVAQLLPGRYFTGTPRHVQSESGWNLHIIQDGNGCGEMPKSLGVIVSRHLMEPLEPYADPVWYDDAYIWVQPEFRGQGVATTAYEQRRLGQQCEVRPYHSPEPTAA